MLHKGGWGKLWLLEGDQRADTQGKLTQLGKHARKE